MRTNSNFVGRYSLSEQLQKQKKANVMLLVLCHERGKKKGRQRKRWEDNIREWAGLEFGKSEREVENREK